MKTNDPIELEFMAMCDRHGITCIRPQEWGSRLDFYLPGFDLYVEVKAYSCERLHGQLESANAGPCPVMVLVGLRSVKILEQLISFKKLS